MTKELAKEIDQLPNPELPDERERKFQSPGFSRIRMQWNGPEGQIVNAMHASVQRKIDENFEDAYSLMYEIYDLVREVELDPKGSPVLAADGLPRWKRTPSGNFVEDWSKLTYRQRERFLFQLTTRLFEWEQRATEAWAESMFAKVTWEQTFSNGFESLEGTRPTVDARTARGKIVAREEHYLAIFMTYYSRRAEAIVRAMTLLAQRIRDVHVANGTR